MKNYLLTLLLLVPMLASAYDAEIDGIYYNLVSLTKSAEVTFGDNHYKDSITIPASIVYKGVEYPVRSIGDNAFYFCYEVTSVTIPSSVRTIGEKAFAYCI